MYRTANLQSCILYIYSTTIGTEYFKHGTLLFFSTKCSLFHNCNVFGSCIIHILYTGVLKLKKKNNSGTKRLRNDIRTFIPHHNGMNGVGVLWRQQTAHYAYAARRKLAQSKGDKPRFGDWRLFRLTSSRFPQQELLSYPDSPETYKHLK